MIGELIYLKVLNDQNTQRNWQLAADEFSKALTSASNLKSIDEVDINFLINYLTALIENGVKRIDIVSESIRRFCKELLILLVKHVDAKVFIHTILNLLIEFAYKLQDFKVKTLDFYFLAHEYSFYVEVKELEAKVTIRIAKQYENLKQYRLSLFYGAYSLFLLRNNIYSEELEELHNTARQILKKKHY